jgi:hypothetical protein
MQSNAATAVHWKYSFALSVAVTTAGLDTFANGRGEAPAEEAEEEVTAWWPPDFEGDKGATSAASNSPCPVVLPRGAGARCLRSGAMEDKTAAAAKGALSRGLRAMRPTAASRSAWEGLLGRGGVGTGNAD